MTTTKTTSITRADALAIAIERCADVPEVADVLTKMRASITKPRVKSDAPSKARVENERLARALADAIPALSFAVGANPVDRWDNNDLASDDVETWFKDPKIINILDSEKEREWSHTFFLKVPYMVVHKLFEDIVGKIEQGENQ